MYRRILVAVEGSSTADAALREAIDLARDTHGRVPAQGVSRAAPISVLLAREPSSGS